MVLQFLLLLQLGRCVFMVFIKVFRLLVLFGISMFLMFLVFLLVRIYCGCGRVLLLMWMVMLLIVFQVMFLCLVLCIMVWIFLLLNFMLILCVCWVVICVGDSLVVFGVCIFQLVLWILGGIRWFLICWLKVKVVLKESLVISLQNRLVLLDMQWMLVYRFMVRVVIRFSRENRIGILCGGWDLGWMDMGKWVL